MATMTADYPRRYRFTTDEYFRLGETGVLPPDARVELIEGEIIDMSPIGTPHAAIVERLVDLLKGALGHRAMVRAQHPVLAGKYSAPQPDIAVVARRDDYYAHAHPKTRDVLLVIEVADTTLAYDREVKAGMYARSGVPEAWIVDVDGRTVTRLHSLRDDTYAAVALRVGESIAIGALPDVRIEVRAIFAS
jgi:Uma2 family endonuclease